MVADLFSTSVGLERVPMPDSEVYHLRSLDLGRSPSDILAELVSATPWRQESVTVWGRSYLQPRLVAWYGDQGRQYSYSGITLNPLPWTNLLVFVRERVEAAAGDTFNSVLLNYYRNENDSMGFHSDDEPELGSRPVIASLSLGELRTFVFKPRQDKLPKSIRIQLRSGDLLLMKGDTQVNWRHAIAKERRSCGPRVNLTFRRIVSA
jgi:alkylated DNA repair dioxygenase AlkB